MAASTNPVHLFGVRHHGPGCARSLLKALEELQPDCVLIEGPPEADALLALAGAEGMEPPVALLLYAPEAPQYAAFYPFAEFSPEWQALRYALRQGVLVQFMDLPQTHGLALAKERETAPAVDVPTPDPQEGRDDPDLRHDPLGWLGQAAGYGGGEEWWEHTVEQRQDGAELFTAIGEALTAVRAETPPLQDAFEARREKLREAFMRKTIRAAQKQGRERIAVVCGAWHVPALAEMPSVGADNELLKGLPKIKIEATWIPWTYDRMAAASGYRAGVDSPAWYEHLWRRGGRADPAAWFARVAKLLRQADLDCSSAHIIECVRLSEALAAVRERPAPGLAEMMEAAQTVLTTGEDAPLRLIRRDLIIGRRFGAVADGAPTVPLQRDLEQRRKTLRLKVSATQETLTLDLREEINRARSQFLYRLVLLRVPWGQVTEGRGKGTFKEIWTLQWQPEFALAVIEAAPYGNTVAEAATAFAQRRAMEAHDLPPLTELVSQLLLADLPEALAVAMHELENRAALTGDLPQLMSAMPPLAQVARYSDVRNTDADQVLRVFDGLLVRVCIGLTVTAQALDDEAAADLAERIGSLHKAIKLVDHPDQQSAWLNALRQTADADGVHHRVRGLAARILLDEQADVAEDAAARMSRALSRAAAPDAAAAWLEGFLSDGGTILAHDPALFGLVDQWVVSLSAEHFIQVLPLVRRTFATFPAPVRRQIGQQVKQASHPIASTAAAISAENWDMARAEALIPTLKQILGIDSST